jgi:hypothetical protein
MEMVDRDTGAAGDSKGRLAAVKAHLQQQRQRRQRRKQMQKDCMQKTGSRQAGRQASCIDDACFSDTLAIYAGVREGELSWVGASRVKGVGGQPGAAGESKCSHAAANTHLQQQQQQQC